MMKVKVRDIRDGKSYEIVCVFAKNSQDIVYIDFGLDGYPEFTVDTLIETLSYYREDDS